MRIGTGFIKKIVFADVLAGYVDVVFDHPAGFSGFNILLAVYAYAYARHRSEASCIVDPFPCSCSQQRYSRRVPRPAID